MSESKEPHTSSITPREHIRICPGMYIGQTDHRAPNQMIFHVVDEMLFGNILDANYQRGDQIFVILLKDNAVSISDNGSGLPVARKDVGNMTISQLELIMTRVPGVSNKWYFWFVINALSAQLTAEVRRDDFVWRQTYSEGNPTSDVVQVRPLEPNELTGTTITLTPDFSILQPSEFSFPTLSKRLRKLAFLFPGLTLTLKDQREQSEGNEISFHYPNGAADFVAYVNRNNTPIHSIIRGHGDVETKTQNEQPCIVGVEIAFQYIEQSSGFAISYVNAHETTHGGTHVEGLLQALRWYVGDHIKLDELEMNEVVSQGLTAVVHVMHPHPVYMGSMKSHLINPEIREAVYEVASTTIREFSEQHPDGMQRLVDHFLARKQERDQQRFGE